MTQWDFVVTLWVAVWKEQLLFKAQFLKHITSQYEGYQKCMSHAFYASTIPLSDYFVTEQQQTVGRI